MDHPRYGDLELVWDKTAGRCHLCHDDVDLGTYGLVEIFGREAATVDHLVPQSHGGDDLLSNLLPAHHGCNASRGTRDPVEARFEMSGLVRPPRSTYALVLGLAREARKRRRRLAKTTTVAVGAGLWAGCVLADNDAGGRQFNWGAALLAGAVAGLVVEASG